MLFAEINQILFKTSLNSYVQSKTGSDKVIFWNGRYSLLLGFIMLKKCERLHIELSIRIQNPKTFGFFDMIKLRRKEYLPSRKIVLSEPVFSSTLLENWVLNNLESFWQIIVAYIVNSYFFIGKDRFVLTLMNAMQTMEVVCQILFVWTVLEVLNVASVSGKY